MQFLWVTLMIVIPVQFGKAGNIECLIALYMNKAGYLFYII